MRKLAMAMVVSGALGSSFANALGLGEIKLNSALNQPLDAEVKLLNVGDLSKNEILPNLGSHEDFSRAGVERVFFLTGIKFDVELDGKGGAVIHLTTDRIVREPYLNFLVELHWPSGRLLREYTALMDPPMFSEIPPAPVAPAATTPAYSAPAPKATPAPAPTYSSPARDEAPAAAPIAAQPKPGKTSDPRDGTVRVKKNDTLWDIAKENRPDRSVTIRQTMLAIQQHNPSAFIRNNINLLKSGQVLRIPGVEEIRRVSSSQANVETARQNQEWASKKTIDATQKYDSSATQGADAAADQGGSLKLVATDAESVDDASAENASAGSAAEGDTGTVGQSGAEGAEGPGSAVANVENLQKELQDLQRLLTLKQEQLALLQATQAENAQAESEAQAAATELEAQAVAEEISAESEAAVTDGEALSEAVKADEAALASDAAAQIEDAAAEEPRPEEGIVDILTNNPLYIGVMVVVILGALILLGAISRRRNEEKAYPQELQEALDTADNDVELPDELEQEFAETDDSLSALDDADVEVASSDENEATVAEDSYVTRKLLEEADIYIAYGRYERAIEILQPAVNENPGNAALHLKLAEIFLANGEQSRFTQQEADLQAIGDADALAKVEALKAKHAASASLAEQDETQAQQGMSAEATEQEVAELEDLEFELPDSEQVAALQGDERDKSGANLVEFDMDLEDDDFLDIDAEDAAELQDVDSDNVLEFSLRDDGAVEGQAISAEDMDFLVDTDESATKLELAKAYIDMADTGAAQDILNEVISEGSQEQKDEASKLLENLE